MTKFNTSAGQKHLLAELLCSKCGAIDTPTILPGNGPHAFRAHCRHCGTFITWRSKYTPEEQQARRQQAQHHAMTRRPPSQKQLACLKRLGDTGTPPATMFEASQRIETLKRVEVL